MAYRSRGRRSYGRRSMRGRIVRRRGSTGRRRSMTMGRQRIGYRM